MNGSSSSSSSTAAIGHIQEVILQDMHGESTSHTWSARKHSLHAAAQAAVLIGTAVLCAEHGWQDVTTCRICPSCVLRLMP
jgi:hypothetical protein